MKRVAAFSILLAWLAIPGTLAVHAQSGPEKGGHELELWTSGGHALNGITSNTGVWTVGARYGWILTDPRGPGMMKGRFEYALDVVPVFWVFHPSGAAYGVAINPLALKWNLVTRRRAVPYFELGSGVLLTNSQVPAGTSRLNFTTGGGIGMHVLGKKLNCSAEVRFLHISNSSISSENPGINTLQLRLGIGMFSHRSPINVNSQN